MIDEKSETQSESLTDPIPGSLPATALNDSALESDGGMDPLPGSEAVSKVITGNPFTKAPGQDVNIRSFMFDLYERSKDEAGFNLDDVRTWKQEDSKAAVLALAQDYLITHGNGFDWASAAEKAEMFCAGMYHELVYRANLPTTPQLHINFYDGFKDEGFELVLNRPMASLMDPLPGMNMDDQSVSRRRRASLLVAPSFDALTVHEKALEQSFSQIGQFFDNHGRLALQFTAAFIVLWKGLQVCHVVRSGAVYRGIRNTEIPDMPSGDMRLVFARTGERITQLSKQDPDSLVLSLD